MPGITKLKKCQLGLESTKGTAVDATALWLGDVDLVDNSEATFPKENVGRLGRQDRSYIAYMDAKANFKETEASFEQIGYPLSAGIQDTVSGTANGGTSNAYRYTYSFPTTAPRTTKAYTIEGGDNQQEYEVAYGFCEEINLKGSPKEAVKIQSNWPARSMNKGTYTANVAVPTVEYILFQKGKIYLDAIDGTVGTTQLTNTWLGFDMKIKTGLIAVATADGNLFFSFDKCTDPDVMGSITFEHDAVGVARYDDYKAGTTRKVRMEFLGSATGYTGAGGTFTSRALRIDMAMKIISIDPLGSVNGNDVSKINFAAVDSTVGSLYFDITVCNLLSALT